LQLLSQRRLLLLRRASRDGRPISRPGRRVTAGGVGAVMMMMMMMMMMLVLVVLLPGRLLRPRLVGRRYMIEIARWCRAADHLAQHGVVQRELDLGGILLLGGLHELEALVEPAMNDRCSSAHPRLAINTHRGRIPHARMRARNECKGRGISVIIDHGLINITAASHLIQKTVQQVSPVPPPAMR
jgi:hypothetical protein